MKPRVFVSSTYYDLKYVRENLEHFITQYGFDAVLFESGRVTFEYGKSLDTSCYQEVDSCHMMTLIIGGRYGSASSTESTVEKRQKYDTEYVSITRKEFETAQERGIPIFVFIDKNVYAEYHTYKQNEVFFMQNEESNSSFRFAHVDSINIFKFIDTVSHIAIKTFERADEIIEYLRAQYAGMFFLYLEQLQRESSNKEIITSIKQLNTMVTKMDIIVDSMARKIIDEKHFKELEEKQYKAVVHLFMEQVKESLSTDELDNPQREKYADYLINDFLFKESKSYEDIKNNFINVVNKTKFKNKPALTMKIYTLYTNFIQKIKPFVNSSSKRSYFRTELVSALDDNDLPF